MPKLIQTKTIENVLSILKKRKEIGKSELIKLTKIQGNHLDKILEILAGRGDVIIAKMQTFKGDKIIVQSYDIKYVGDKNEKISST